jgi:hypothetical protein
MCLWSWLQRQVSGGVLAIGLGGLLLGGVVAGGVDAGQQHNDCNAVDDGVVEHG